MVNSPLRWAGSKRSLLSEIRQAWPSEAGRYYEPFMGSACVYFELTPAGAFLSDYNSELVQFFIELQRDVDGLIAEFEALDDTGDAYYEVRSLEPGALSNSHRAARFLYLNRFAFNGVYRTNRSGQFNVPRGARTGALPSRNDLETASSKLADVSITTADWRDAIADARPGDFVYLDPPYRNQQRDTYGEYGYGSFGSAADVQDLAAELERLNGAGVKVLLSFNDDDELRGALDGWTLHRIERRRSVAGTAKSRTSLSGEILAMNYTPRANIA